MTLVLLVTLVLLLVLTGGGFAAWTFRHELGLGNITVDGTVYGMVAGADEVLVALKGGRDTGRVFVLDRGGTLYVSTDGHMVLAYAP